MPFKVLYVGAHSIGIDNVPLEEGLFAVETQTQTRASSVLLLYIMIMHAWSFFRLLPTQLCWYPADLPFGYRLAGGL